MAKTILSLFPAIGSLYLYYSSIFLQMTQMIRTRATQLNNYKEEEKENPEQPSQHGLARQITHDPTFYSAACLFQSDLPNTAHTRAHTHTLCPL